MKSGIDSLRIFFLGDLGGLAVQSHFPGFARVLLLLSGVLPFPAMLVLIDNYDSFTYNLVQKLGEIDPRRSMKVFRNDKVSIAEIEALKPTHIVISPGPCRSE